jgi:MoaA/NifB/PqqE/SkfB family radical SAM enzyme
MHVYGHLTGEYALCCHTLSSQVPETEKTYGKGLSPLEAFNSDYIKKVRLGMLEGRTPAACQVCDKFEESNNISHRLQVNQRFHLYTNLFDYTNKDGSVNNPPFYLDIRFGNLCNFKCRMCGPEASSSWYKDNQKLKIFKSTYDKAVFDPWTDNEDLWRDIDKIKSHIKLIYFAGGEPFVQEGHYKLLKFLVDSNCTDIDLEYNTNLSYDSKFKAYDIEDLWRHFKSIQLWPSIDGFKNRAEYGRKGLVWELFETNSKKFSSYINTYSIVNNIYSVSSIPDLIKWVKDQGKSFYITNLVHPSYQSVTILPKNIKADLISKYKELLYESSLSDEEARNVIDCLKHLKSADNTNLGKPFKQQNQKLDLLRNESFSATYPEFDEWYSNI